MGSHRTGSSRRNGRRCAAWAALAIGWLLPSVGCQVEYAGMTLPSGKYMHDDVQYFPKGPEFPWANTQAATQRARMRAMGMDVPGSADPITSQRSSPGTIPGQQRQFGNPTDVNASPLEDVPEPPNPGLPPADPGLPIDHPAAPGAPAGNDF